MVGIHDVISVILSGHHALIKHSHKDKVLLSYLLQKLVSWDSSMGETFTEVEKLSDLDAVIATGGDTAATHFKSYFGKYPHIIRKNRTSVAVLEGAESKEELALLGHDILSYYGLGCRNVSKIFAPVGYNWETFYEAIFDFSDIINHHKYKNNYDYTHAIYLLGQHPFLTNNFLILREDESLHSRISCVHYEYYDGRDMLHDKIKKQAEDIQCVTSNTPIADLPVIALGTCQSPGLKDYADRVDTMAFLTRL